MGASTVAVTEATFENDVLNADRPVLVDFWASWCKPCLALGPKLEEIAQEMNSKIIVAKVNTDENPEIAARYGIRGIPTMILFKNGKEVEQLVGNQPKENIVAMINKNI